MNGRSWFFFCFYRNFCDKLQTHYLNVCQMLIQYILFGLVFLFNFWNSFLFDEMEFPFVLVKRLYKCKKNCTMLCWNDSSVAILNRLERFCKALNTNNHISMSFFLSFLVMYFHTIVHIFSIWYHWGKEYVYVKNLQVDDIFRHWQIQIISKVNENQFFAI